MGRKLVIGVHIVLLRVLTINELYRLHEHRWGPATLLSFLKY